jgi:hypothetical protein
MRSAELTADGVAELVEQFWPLGGETASNPAVRGSSA